MPKTPGKMIRGLVGAAPILFLRRLRSDATLGLSRQDSEVLHAIRLSDRSVYEDRFREFRSFWGVGLCSCVRFMVRYGWPFSSRLRETLMERFEGRTDPGVLLSAYRDSAFHYAMLLMLSMHRGEWISPFVPLLREQFSAVDDWQVLDYGCGVSDIGLILAAMGARVTIADLDDRKLAFAHWRYRQRDLPCEVIPVRDTEVIPDLGDSRYDLVLATEILEHVRDPLALLRALTRSLKAEGLLFNTLEDRFDREEGGDHLSEAFEVGNSPEYREYFRTKYELSAKPDGRPWLFRRTRS